MTKASYTYEVTNFADRECIIIEDRNLGGMSVTNSIEDVIKEISEKEQLRPDVSYMIVYKDSEGLWDGWDTKAQQFIPLQCSNPWHAIRRYIKRLNSSPNSTHKSNTMLHDPKDGVNETTSTEEAGPLASETPAANQESDETQVDEPEL